LRWTAVAASILLLLTTGLWLHSKHRENRILVEKDSSDKQRYKSPVEDNSEMSPEQHEKTVSTATTYREVIKTQTQVRKNRQHSNSITSPHVNERTEPLNTVQSKAIAEDDKQQQNNVGIELQPLATPEIVLLQVAEKRKKHPYVTIDFSERNKIIPPAHEEKVFAQLFQLKIFPAQEEPFTTTNIESNFLKIKKKF
jgi:hypothetical protein